MADRGFSGSPRYSAVPEYLRSLRGGGRGVGTADPFSRLSERHLLREPGLLDFWRKRIGVPVRRTPSAERRRSLGLIRPISARDYSSAAFGLGPHAPGLREAARRSLDPYRDVLPPRLLRSAEPVIAVNAVSYDAYTDYPQIVRVAGGHVEHAGVLRVVYVAPVAAVDGVPTRYSEAPHVLMSAAFSTRAETLGELVGEPVVLLNVARRTDSPVHFYGFESAQYDPATPNARPIFVGVSESLVDGSVDYFIVDHKPTTGEPFVKYIDGVPAGRQWAGAPLHHRTMPGIAFARVRESLVHPVQPRVLLALVLGNDTAASCDVALGYVHIGIDDATYQPTDQARIAESMSAYTYVWESIPVTWHHRRGRWLIMTTIADFDARFHLAHQSGRLLRGADGLPILSRWWPPQSETGHVGNDIAVNPVTGNVIFHTGHNTASGLVTRDQDFINQWRGLYAGATVEAGPEAFPAGYVFGRDGPRWTATVCESPHWEFQAAGSPGVAVAVGDRGGSTGGETAVITRDLFDGEATTFGRGVHRIVGIGSARSAHLIVWGSRRSASVSIGVAFTGGRAHW